MKHTYLLIFLSLFGLKLSAQDIVISGVYDAQSSVLLARGVELYVCNDITDLSVYGIGSANNGGGSDGEEFTFPAISATTGDFIYVAGNDPKFTEFFGFTADHITTALDVNGDDAIELFFNGAVVDVFGDINTDGTGTNWEFADGWAYRVDATPINNGSWSEAAFTYSGKDELEGATNSVATTPFPLGTYAKVASTDPIVSFDIASQMVEENVGSITIDINILQENANPTTVDVVIGAASTANASDYTFTDPTTITFPASSSASQQLIIPITDDTDPEGTEDLIVILSNPGNNAEISLLENTHTVTINVSDAPAPTTDIVITEIMYNPPETGTDSLEFIEVYNNGSSVIDLDGWSFTEGVDYIFNGVTLNPGEFIILAEDSQALENNYGYVGAINWSGSLTNGGEAIVLIDAFGQIADSVDYEDNTAPWDENADGTGSSLILCDPNSDNSDGANWEAAHSSYGNGQLIEGLELKATPGSLDGCAPIVTDPIVSFDTTSTTVDENVGAVTIDLHIVNENANATSADIILGVSTATDVDDFIYIPTTVTFPANSSTVQQITVNIVDDIDAEMMETIVFEITNVTNAGVAGANDTHTVNINISDAPAAPSDVYITEIMYNPPESNTDSLEYIEVYNNSLAGVDMSGWSFSSGVEYDFPSTMLPSGSTIVIAKNASAINNNFSITGTEQWTSGTLSNTGEILTIIDAFGSVIDSVRYDDGGDWDTTSATVSDGGGASLVFCDPLTDNDLGINWEVCNSDYATGNIINGFDLTGTPGLQAGCDAASVGVVEAEDVLISIYPNPVPNGLLNLNVKKAGLVTIYNLVGKVLLNKQINANQNEINVSGFSAGVYLIKFNQNGNSVTKRFVIR